MGGAIHIRVEPPRRVGGALRFAARVEGLAGAPDALHYDVRAPEAEPLAPDGAPFLLALLFPAMASRKDLVLDAPVSGALLDGLACVADTWCDWRPNRYARVEIDAPVHPTAPAVREPDGRITAFSGGLDSCYSLARWRRWARRGTTPRLTAGVFVHGFDIPLARDAESHRAEDAARRIAASAGLALFAIRTNLRLFPLVWEDGHGAALAAVLHLFQGAYGGGLVPATVSVQGLGDRWGTHPALDPWLSSEHFAVASDGHEASRSMKVAVLADWPEARDDLRVCYEAPDLSTNCQTCRKCLFTKCMMLARDIPLGRSLARAPTRAETAGLRLPEAWKRRLVAETLADARAHGRDREPWAAGLRRALWLHRLLPGWGRRREPGAAPFPAFDETPRAVAAPEPVEVR